ncbi:hypothetical protein [Salibacterium halotolerans]|uniref:Uncharacterized protein n=1 Tax=Salibacterium halotolerans TaxID=1884432 RepID=A0A1I5MJJ4_9BACI|nr:hypothetical protein [Salibacterium halotolerans]SFP09663.1 hypothetical protein SAMN05518683_102257 [Salibacterium halotolerans]
MLRKKAKLIDDIPELGKGNVFWIRPLSETGDVVYVYHEHIKSESAYCAVMQASRFDVIEDEPPAVAEQMTLF